MSVFSLTNFMFLGLMVALTSCASFKSQEERQADTKIILGQFIDLVKKGNLPKAEELFYQNTNCSNDEGRGCYRYILKGEYRRFRASDSYDFDLLVNHIQVVSACMKSKDSKQLEACVRKQKRGVYVKYILPENSYNEEDTNFDVKRFCEFEVSAMVGSPEHNDLFRAVKWSDFQSLDENICEVL